MNRAEDLNGLRGELRLDEPLARHTSRSKVARNRVSVSIFSVMEGPAFRIR